MDSLIHDQAKNLRRQLGVTKQETEAKTISIISGKGGVGKSNFAINFALELLNNGKKVLIVDLDVGMGNIDILLGLQAKKTIIDMLNDRLAVQDIIETGPNQLSYIAGGSGLSGFFTMNQEKMDYFLTQYDELVGLYDFIIFDMGAGVSTDSMFFILASDECVLVTTGEPTSLTDAYGMIKHVVNNGGKMPIYVVMNRCYSTKNGKQTLVRFQHIVSQFLHFQIEMMGILPEDKTVSSAVMRQTPYLLMNKKSSVSVAMKQIVSNYLSNSKELNKLKPFSFIQKLKHLLRER